MATSLSPPPSVRELQTAPRAKAKAASGHRFYALYDERYRRDVPLHAYRCCRANQGSPGVDGQSFDDIESAGLGSWLGKLRLRVNERKTRRRQLPDETSDFLGYTFGRCYSVRSGWAYLSPKPRKSKARQVCREVSELTDRRWRWKDVSQVVARLNAKMSGWANHFCLGPVRQVHRVIDEWR